MEHLFNHIIKAHLKNNEFNFLRYFVGELHNDIEPQILNDLMCASAKFGKMNCIKLLLKHGCDINIIDRDNGNTLLINACADTSSLDCVLFLLDMGANINMRCGQDGWTALIYIVRFYISSTSGLKYIELLLDRGANINLTNNSSSTALMYAARHCVDDAGVVSLECVQLLLDRGADINIQCIDEQEEYSNWNALMFASSSCETTSSIKCVELLLKYGADKEIIKSDGTILSYLDLLPEKYKKKREKIYLSRECITCYNLLNSFVACLIPCGHACLCDVCLGKIEENDNKCPVCKETFEDYKVLSLV